MTRGAIWKARRLALLMLAGPAVAAPTLVAARDGWAAFAGDGRCWAVSRAWRTSRGAQAEASLALWRAPGTAPQLAVRLSRPHRPGTAVRLVADGRGINLLSRGTEAWAAAPPADAAIIAAMRGGHRLWIAATDLAGRPFRDVYRLPGAATAIDAAMLACR